MTTYDIDFDQMPGLKNSGKLEKQEFICESQNATVYKVGQRYRILLAKLYIWDGNRWVYTGYNGTGARWKRIVLEKDLDDYL